MDRNERAGWVCGMCIGFIFGLLCIQVSSFSWFAAIVVVIAWLYVMVAYMKIGSEEIT